MSPDQYPRTWECDRTINIWDEATQTIQVSDPLDVSLKDFDGAWANLEQEEPELHQRLARVRLELRRLLTGKQPIYGFKRDEIVAALKIDDLKLSLEEIERIRAATAPSLSELFGAVDRIDTTEITRQITNLKAKIERRSAKLDSCEAEILKLKGQLKGLGILFGGVDEQTTKAQIDSLSIDVKALKSEIKLMNVDQHELETEYKTMKAVSKQVQNSDRRAQSEALANVFVCWLAPFLEILFGTSIGTFSIQYGKLFVHRVKQQHQNIIHEARANIFLDATTTAESISFRTGIPAERILVCEAIHDQGAVVHHIQVKDFGLAAKNRADSTDIRIKAAIAGIKNQHDGCNAVEFDHLGKANVTNAQGVHFRDSRGENSFMKNNVFVHVGLPMPNIGAVRIDFEILERPGAPSFEAYYQDICDAELFQEMGRDRALRRDGNIFHYWLTDLELPFAAQHMKAADISINAASQADITRASIGKAIANLAKSGGKLTQEAIA
jgi:hypothetical protein